ncbi:ubiquinone biosynthesis protein [Caulobacter sp. Root1455]|uniref:Coq4 family protein n=1 Tax=unclassified Caulobacter TaxID=2648921 RepID=UPI0006FA08DF|nr:MULTISPECIES: Coq4 family protein [unclassified Caulobacter]KQY30913.1 ubiquinone biosynthesis protein [Caulobacter sp. Root487D2Y]KQY95206.1 ubiquinone biosynthesis protein [Caulobacter sp. Root1455]
MIAATQVLGGPKSRQPMQRGRQSFNLQPLRALRAVRRLIADKEDTAQVFEIMRALAGNAIPKGYRRLLSTPEGGRIAYEHDEFAERLSDPVWLAQFGPGTVGAAYRDFIAPRGLSAEGLAEESRKIPESDVDAAHPLAWYARRMRDVHDVWHVLTGYGTDALGEVCVVAFSYAQTRSLGFAVIALAGARQFQKARLGQPYGKAVREAWRNGRSAAWLPAVDYPALFAMPLDEARRTYKVAPNTAYQAIPPQYRDRIAEAA